MKKVLAFLTVLLPFHSSATASITVLSQHYSVSGIAMAWQDCPEVSYSYSGDTPVSGFAFNGVNYAASRADFLDLYAVAEMGPCGAGAEAFSSHEFTVDAPTILSLSLRTYGSIEPRWSWATYSLFDLTDDYLIDERYVTGSADGGTWVLEGALEISHLLQAEHHYSLSLQLRADEEGWATIDGSLGAPPPNVIPVPRAILLASFGLGTARVLLPRRK